eukprot:TRINITY_DN27155_c0_g1_i2.p1 TRINITY_DN27155_c0_g1~~TRINITY_DN27155_c0_g1_i2.p1  ORF type:complete len:611 (-),score=208.53 TRINITY_DN27155_c0_g1_i2:112-1689(-)
MKKENESSIASLKKEVVSAQEDFRSVLKSRKPGIPTNSAEYEVKDSPKIQQKNKSLTSNNADPEAKTTSMFHHKNKSTVDELPGDAIVESSEAQESKPQLNSKVVSEQLNSLNVDLNDSSVPNLSKKVEDKSEPPVTAEIPISVPVKDSVKSIKDDGKVKESNTAAIDFRGNLKSVKKTDPEVKEKQEQKLEAQDFRSVLKSARKDVKKEEKPISSGEQSIVDRKTDLPPERKLEPSDVAENVSKGEQNDSVVKSGAVVIDENIIDEQEESTGPSKFTHKAQELRDPLLDRPTLGVNRRRPKKTAPKSNPAPSSNSVPTSSNIPKVQNSKAKTADATTQKIVEQKVEKKNFVQEDPPVPRIPMIAGGGAAGLNAAMAVAAKDIASIAASKKKTGGVPETGAKLRRRSIDRALPVDSKKNVQTSVNETKKPNASKQGATSSSSSARKPVESEEKKDSSTSQSATQPSSVPNAVAARIAAANASLNPKKEDRLQTPTSSNPRRERGSSFSAAEDVKQVVWKTKNNKK